MTLDFKQPSIEQLMLINMLLKSETDKMHIQRLPEIVADHLARGQRVVVGRLYDLDHTINPWYGMNRAGWPRARIQDLLEGYCTRKIGMIDDVVFREIFICGEKE